MFSHWLYYLASYSGFSYKVLHMYDVEKWSAVLENAAGFARTRRVYIYIYGPITNSIGVCLYIGETNFVFP